MVGVDVSGLLAAQVGWLGLRVAGHLVLSVHSSDEPDVLLYWLMHDDSTINISMDVIIIVIWLHHSAMYIDMYCHYRQSSVVCQLRGSVAIMSPAKTAELIEMPFGLWTRVGQSNHVLDGVQIPCAKG